MERTFFSTRQQATRFDTPSTDGSGLELVLKFVPAQLDILLLKIALALFPLQVKN